MAMQIAVYHAYAAVAATVTDQTFTCVETGLAIAVGTGHFLSLLSASILVAPGGSETDVTFNSKGGSAGTAISATFPCNSPGGFVMPQNPNGWTQTNTHEVLTISSAGDAASGVQIVYAEMKP